MSGKALAAGFSRVMCPWWDRRAQRGLRTFSAALCYNAHLWWGAGSGGPIFGAVSRSGGKQLRRLSAKGEIMSETDRAARVEQYRAESQRTAPNNLMDSDRAICCAASALLFGSVSFPSGRKSTE